MASQRCCAMDKGDRKGVAVRGGACSNLPQLIVILFSAIESGVGRFVIDVEQAAQAFLDQ